MRSFKNKPPRVRVVADGNVHVPLVARGVNSVSRIHARGQLRGRDDAYAGVRFNPRLLSGLYDPKRSRWGIMLTTTIDHRSAYMNTATVTLQTRTNDGLVWSGIYTYEAAAWGGWSNTTSGSLFSQGATRIHQKRAGTTLLLPGLESRNHVHHEHPEL